MGRVGSFHPGDFAPEFDLVQELRDNLAAYESPDDPSWLSMPGFPGYLLTSVDCCRAHCQLPKRPSRSAAMVCCIGHGIDFLYEDPDIQALIQAREKLHRLAGKAADSSLLEMGAEFFRHFPLGIPGTISQPQRINVPMPAEIKSQVSERASELGLDNFQIGILAVMEVVSHQTVVHRDHAALASDTIKKFLRGVRLRRRVAELFLEHAV